MKIDWSNSQIDHAAKALLVINPLGHNSAEDVAAHIRKVAENSLAWDLANGMTPSYFGTGGWYVTFCQTDGAEPDEWKALVTLMAFSVNRFLAGVGSE